MKRTVRCMKPKRKGGFTDEVKTIIESFRDQLKAAGIDRFEKYVKDVYEEDPDSVSFYD